MSSLSSINTIFIINILGIIFSLIGTFITLWTILTVNANTTSTHRAIGNRHNDVAKEKQKAYYGFYLMLIGAILQIYGQYLSIYK